MIKATPIKTSGMLVHDPFGMITVGRNWEVGSEYRFGYQGSLQDDEIYGAGNSYSTFFRELDVRLGRWWSNDPKGGHTPWSSPYVMMNDNPILYTDIYGDIVEHSKFRDKINTTVGRIFKKGFRIDYKVLEASEETYVFNGSKGVNGEVKTGSFTTVGNKLFINYQYGRQPQWTGEGSLSSMYHELKHGIQFEEGRIGFAYLEDEQRWGSLNYDITDEVEAHDAQYRKGFNTYETTAVRDGKVIYGQNGAPMIDIMSTNRMKYTEAETTEEKIAVIREMDYTGGYKDVPDQSLVNKTIERVKNDAMYARPYKPNNYKYEISNFFVRKLNDIQECNYWAKRQLR